MFLFCESFILSVWWVLGLSSFLYLKALCMRISPSTQDTWLLLHIYFLPAVICIASVFILCHIPEHILRASVILHFLSSTQGNNVKPKWMRVILLERLLLTHSHVLIILKANHSHKLFLGKFTWTRFITELHSSHGLSWHTHLSSN